jgi:hypothetical protein
MAASAPAIHVSAKGDSKKADVQAVTRAIVRAGTGTGELRAEDVTTLCARDALPAAHHVIMDWSAQLRRVGAEYLRSELNAAGRDLTWGVLCEERFVRPVRRVVERGRVCVVLVDVRALVFVGKGPEQARRSGERRAPLSMPPEGERVVGVHVPPFAPPRAHAVVPEWECLMHGAGREYLRGIVAWFWAQLRDALPAGRPLLVIGDGVDEAVPTAAAGRVPRVLLCAGEGDAVRELRVPAWRNHFGEADQLIVYYLGLLFVGARTTVHTVDTDTYPQVLMLLDALYRNAPAPRPLDAWVWPWGVRTAPVPLAAPPLDTEDTPAPALTHTGSRWRLPEPLERVARLLGIEPRGVPLELAARRVAVLSTEVCIATPDQSAAAATHTTKRSRTGDAAGASAAAARQPAGMPDFAAMFGGGGGAERPPKRASAAGAAAVAAEAEAAAEEEEARTGTRYKATYVAPLYAALRNAAARCTACSRTTAATTTARASVARCPRRRSWTLSWRR